MADFVVVIGSDVTPEKRITVFCIGQYEFLWTLEINIHLRFKASVNIVFKVHKNSHWPQQKTIIVYYLLCVYYIQLGLYI
jgi:hypothetical protein